PASELFTLSLHDALPILAGPGGNGGRTGTGASSTPAARSSIWTPSATSPVPTSSPRQRASIRAVATAFGERSSSRWTPHPQTHRSEEHTSELQSRGHLVC